MKPHNNGTPLIPHSRGVRGGKGLLGLYSDKHATRASHRFIEGCALVGDLFTVTTGVKDFQRRSARSVYFMLA